MLENVDGKHVITSLNIDLKGDPVIKFHYRVDHVLMIAPFSDHKPLMAMFPTDAGVGLVLSLVKEFDLMNGNVYAHHKDVVVGIDEILDTFFCWRRMVL